MNKWRYQHLESLADFRNGINYSSANFGQGIKVISVADFQDYFSPRYHELSEIDPDGVVRSEDLLAENDIVFVRSNGNRDLIGRSLFIQGLDEHITHSGFTIRLRFFSHQVVPKFYAQLFKSNLIRRELSKSGSGTNISNLSQKILKEILVPLPPLSEQCKIAEILSAWDEAIAHTEELIAALEQRKKGLMQRLLADEVRNYWKQKKLGNVAKILLSNVDKKSKQDEHPVRLCNYMDVFSNKYIRNDMPFMEATAKQREIYKFSLLPGDVILTKDSETIEDIAQAAVVAEELENVVCGYHLAVLRPKAEQILGAFLQEILLVPDIHYQFERVANGVTRFGLTLDSMKKIMVPIPPLNFQKKVSEIFYLMEIERILLLRNIDLLREQKKGLMQRLLTGEVRVQV